MTSRSSRFAWLACLAIEWPLILTGLLSIALATFVWTRPVPTLWTEVPKVVDSIIQVIGITNHGEVVSIDCPPGEVVSTLLCS